jgi:hypothetical protein
LPPSPARGEECCPSSHCCCCCWRLPAAADLGSWALPVCCLLLLLLEPACGG